MKHVDVIIIGGGPAGISAAIWFKRLGIESLLLERKKQLGGQLTNIQNKIIDYPGIDADDGKQIQQIFIDHFHRLGCPYQVNTNILSVDPIEKLVKIEQSNQIEEIHFNYLVLAAGAVQRKLEIPGEKEMLERGEDFSATTDRFLFKGKTVAVVGGGDRAFEGAVLLADSAENIFLIHRSEHFKARKQYRDLVAEKKNIKVLTNTQVTAIHGDQCVSSIELQTTVGKVFTLNVDAVFVRIGTKANTDLIKGMVSVSDDGLIVTNQVGETSNNSIFAIGDICTNPLYSSISSSVGQGAIVAKHISSLFKGVES